MERIRKWLRHTFPGLYKRFGHYFHTYYRLRRRILRDARRHPARYAEAELAAAVARLAERAVSVFSFAGCDRYDSLAVDVHRDDDGFPWVDHGGRRLYFRRETSDEGVAGSYRALRREQDAASPHCYRTEGFELREGDTLLDVGSAEGIFALENVERARRVVLFEVDGAWRGALERTFAPWRDKLVIISKFAADADSADSVTIDGVVREHGLVGPLLLKMDVEGAEARVLAGARGTLACPGTRAVVCTYHRAEDHGRLSASMREGGFSVATSRGWMLFLPDAARMRPPFFRRGVIYCTPCVTT